MVLKVRIALMNQSVQSSLNLMWIVVGEEWYPSMDQTLDLKMVFTQTVGTVECHAH